MRTVVSRRRPDYEVAWLTGFFPSSNPLYLQLHRKGRLVPFDRSTYTSPHFDTLAYIGKPKSSSSTSRKSKQQQQRDNRRSTDSRTLSIRSSSSSINMKAHIQTHAHGAGGSGRGLGRRTSFGNAAVDAGEKGKEKESDIALTVEPSSPPSVWPSASAAFGSSVGSGTGSGGRQVRNTPSILFGVGAGMGAGAGSGSGVRNAAAVHSWKAKCVLDSICR